MSIDPWHLYPDSADIAPCSCTIALRSLFPNWDWHADRLVCLCLRWHVLLCYAINAGHAHISLLDVDAIGNSRVLTYHQVDG